MRTILLLFLSFNLYSQPVDMDKKPCYIIDDYTAQSDWFFAQDFYGYFYGKKNEGTLYIKVRLIDKPLKSGYIFLFCNKGNQAIKIDSLSKRGFFVASVKDWELEAKKTIKSGVIGVGIVTDKRQILYISKRINNNIQEIINFIKPL